MSAAAPGSAARVPAVARPISGSLTPAPVCSRRQHDLRISRSEDHPLAACCHGIRGHAHALSSTSTRRCGAPPEPVGAFFWSLSRRRRHRVKPREIDGNVRSRRSAAARCPRLGRRPGAAGDARPGGPARRGQSRADGDGLHRHDYGRTPRRCAAGRGWARRDALFYRRRHVAGNFIRRGTPRRARPRRRRPCRCKQDCRSGGLCSLCCWRCRSPPR